MILMRSFILFCVLSRVSLQMDAVHHFYMVHKGQSNYQPIHNEYVYNNIKSQPSAIVNFASKHGREKQFGSREKRRIDDLTTTKKTSECSSEFNINENTSKNPLKANPTMFKGKTKVKRYPPKRDVMFEEPDILLSNILPNYERNDYQNDEDDVRTDSRNSNDGWPLFYNSPYEYEPMKFDNEIQKAQDKRFILPEERKVIPVHEHIKDDIIDSKIYAEPDYVYSRHTFTTDNPILGDKAFFSYVLNDYFDKSDDEDPFSFKGLWGKEFDQEMSFHDIDDYVKRMRRLEEVPLSRKEIYDPRNREIETESNKDSLQVTKRDEGYDSKQENEENINKNQNKQSSHTNLSYDGENNRGFKNFADYFANRFGSEDHNNISKHNVKNNVDKGEKKNGYRKVYHKDEYQEHTEFHDNNNKKVDSDNKNESKIHIGGSEGFLNSQATAAVGSDKTKIGRNEDDKREKILRNNKSEQKKLNSNNFSKYRDVAKNAALRNNADYIDRFLT